MGKVGEKMKKRKGYIPTIEGRPARFCEQQLCFCTDDTWQDKPINAIIYKTIEKIQKLIDKTIKFRIKNRYDVQINEYGYIAVEY